jgi:hypothetical protein
LFDTVYCCTLIVIVIYFPALAEHVADAAPARHAMAGQQLPVELKRSCLHQQVPVLGALFFLQAATKEQRQQCSKVSSMLVQQRTVCSVAKHTWRIWHMGMLLANLVTCMN